MRQDADVLVVGAGPTGLTLAGDLALAGVRTTLLERHPGESPFSRAFGVHARTLEVLDMRGLADDLVRTGAKVERLALFDSVHLDMTRLPSRFPFLLITPQYHVERLLERRAVDAGVRVLRGHEVLAVSHGADGVEVQVRADGAERTFRGRYLVGADGVHSVVRRSLGLPFPGRSVLRSIMLADVRLSDPPPDVLAVNAVGDGFAFLAPFGDGWYRVFAWDRRHQVADDAPLGLDEIREVTRRALGTDFGMHDPRWLSRFHSDERQTPSYRVGRVLLAGDAAHVHSPAGGQGMNTGIQDAANLSWKLAAVVDGTASEGVLDTYQEERHPVGRMVLRTSGALIRMAMLRARPARTARNLALGGLLRIAPVRRRAVGSITGIGIGYHRAGTRVADLPLASPELSAGGPVMAGYAADNSGEPRARLYEVLRAGRFVLVLPGGTTTPAAAVPDEVLVVTAADPGTPALLVRPDGYAAWTGSPEDAAAGDWRDGLARWLDLTAQGVVPLSPGAARRSAG